MGFTPKSREEVDDMNVLEPGTYDFEVVEAEEKVSNSGNEMVAINMKVFRKDGSFAFVRDWLMNMDNYYAQHKCRAFLETTGRDEVNEYVQGATGLVALQIEETPQYGKQNKVVGYPTERTQAPDRKEKSEPVTSTGAAFLPPDDEIPF